MNRRKFIMGTGATAAGGASLLGSGAFTSVAAERSVNINVAGDANAFLRLAPCEGSDNGDYVTGAQSGAMSIDLSDGNQDVGDGVNPEALTRIDNIFEICNQGTQDICVDFKITVPEIEGEVPDRYDFEQGDPAVIFYRGSDRDAFVSTEGPNTDRPGAISLPLDNGTCECIGMEIRSFGFSDEDLFADTDLTIVAEADADCTSAVDPDPGAPGPSPAGLVGYWPFDNGDVSDGSATDLSSMNNNGTVNGTVGAKGVGGGSGNAAAFDGTDDYISISNNQTLTFGDGSDDRPFSVSAWVKVPKQTNAHIVGKGANTSSLEYLLNVDTEREWAQFRMYSGSGGNTIYKRVEFLQSNIGEWHHIAGVYDGSGDSSGIRVYVDGNKPAISGTQDNNYTAMDNRGDDIEFGAVLRDNDDFGGFFEGSMDEVRIYDRELDKDEIEALADEFNIE